MLGTFFIWIIVARDMNAFRNSYECLSHELNLPSIRLLEVDHGLHVAEIVLVPYVDTYARKEVGETTI